MDYKKLIIATIIEHGNIHISDFAIRDAKNFKLKRKNDSKFKRIILSISPTVGRK